MKAGSERYPLESDIPHGVYRRWRVTALYKGNKIIIKSYYKLYQAQKWRAHLKDTELLGLKLYDRTEDRVVIWKAPKVSKITLAIDK